MNKMKNAQEFSNVVEKDHQKEILSLKKELKSLHFQNPKELIFSGHLGSMAENPDLKAIIVSVASFITQK